MIRPLPAGVPRDLGRPALPRSKSHAQRALLVAGLGAGVRRISHLPDADDVAVMRAALAALGAELRPERPDAVQVAAPLALRSAAIACADNGTVLRTLLVAVGMLGAGATFTGSARLQARPLDAARAVLAQLGVALSEGWPLQLRAPSQLRVPARLTIDAATTTQPATGALLGMACRSARGLPTVPIEILGAAAAGYLEVTVEVLEALGFVVRVAGNELTVGPSPAEPTAYEVPIDASAAAFPAALAALHGHAADPPAARDRHPDWGVFDDLASLRSAAAGSAVEIADLGRRPDTFPALCAAAAGRVGKTILRGAPALRGKESDRIAAMASGLRSLGVACDELPDGLVVVGRATLGVGEGDPIPLSTPADHRVVMALALLGTRCARGVQVANPRAVAKSWPGFFGWLARVAAVS